MFAELHCHTLFSVDGQGTPEELVDIAANRAISTLVVTEHNHLGSHKRVCDRARERGIRWTTGVEIDAGFEGRGVHLLAYGFDPDNMELEKIIDGNQSRYLRHYELIMKRGKPVGLPIWDSDVNHM